MIGFSGWRVKVAAMALLSGKTQLSSSRHVPYNGTAADAGGLGFLTFEDVPRRSRAVLTGIAFAVGFFYAVYVGAFGVMLPEIGRTLGLGASVSGRLFPASFGGVVAGVLLCGYLSDRFGRKPVLLFCFAAVALGMLLFSRADAFPVALVAAALIGAGNGATQTVATAMLSDLYPATRAFFMNVMQVAFGAGAVLAAPAMQALTALGGTWRTLYLALGVANSLLLVALAPRPVPVQGEADEALDFSVLRTLLRHPTLLLLCLSGALYAGAEVGFFSWMPTYFEKELYGGAALAGLTVSAFWAAMWIGRTVTSGIITRVPLGRLHLLLAGGAALCSTLTLFLAHPALVFAGVALTGLCMSGIFGVLLAEGSERFHKMAGTAIGAITASSSFGVR
jgi:FHS family glucose/mannose:H+ symporter-like MFS transporter